jgi:hypothetical protein
MVTRWGLLIAALLVLGAVTAHARSHGVRQASLKGIESQASALGAEIRERHCPSIQAFGSVQAWSAILADLGSPIPEDWPMQSSGSTCSTPSGKCSIDPAPINSPCCCDFDCGHVTPR